MAIPNGIVSAAGRGPLTLAELRAAFERQSHGFGEAAVLQGHELMTLLGIDPSCWNQVLASSFPTGVPVSDQRTWLAANWGM